MADRRQHPAHLALAALMDHDPKGSMSMNGFEYIDISGGRRAVLEQYPPAEPVEGRQPRRPLYQGKIGLGHSFARVEQPMGQNAVIGQEQQAGGLKIQAAYWKDPDIPGYQIDHARPSLRIPHGADVADGFVQHQIGQGLR